MEIFFYTFSLLIIVRLFLWIIPPRFLEGKTVTLQRAILPVFLLLAGSYSFLSKNGPDGSVFEWMNIRFTPLEDPRQMMFAHYYLDSIQTLIANRQYEKVIYTDLDHSYQPWLRTYPDLSSLLNKGPFLPIGIPGQDLSPDSVRQKSDVSRAFLYRAYAFDQLGKWDNAIDDCNAAMELSPDEKDGVYYLQHRADIYRKSGEYEKAKSDYEAIIAANEAYHHPYVDMVNVYYGYARLSESQGLTNKAFNLYLKAQELAYTYSPCACYNEEKIGDPLACKFTGFDEFTNSTKDEAKTDQVLEKECKNEIPPPKKPKEENYNTKKLKKQDGRPRRIGKKKKKISSKPKQKLRIGSNADKPSLETPATKAKAAYSRAYSQYQKEKKVWEKKIKACVDDKKRRADAMARSAAKNREFSPESAVAYAYYSGGMLRLQENLVRERAVPDLNNLIALCDPQATGACAEFEAFLGEEQYHKLVQEYKKLRGSKEERATRFEAVMTEALYDVKIKRGEGSGKWWWFLLFVISGYVYWRAKKLKAA